MATTKTVKVTVAPTLTGDTVASYNAYSSVDGLLGTLSLAEAAAGKDFSLSDGATHSITVKAVWTTAGETTTVGSNAVSVTTTGTEQWDISAATYDTITTDVSAQMTVDSTCQLIVNPAETKLIIHSHIDEAIYQYDINSDGTLTYDTTFDTSSFPSGAIFNGIAMSHDGNYLAVAAGVTTIQIYNLTTNGSISGMTLKDSPTSPEGARTLAFNDDSTKLFVGQTAGNIYRMTINLAATPTTIVTDTNSVGMSANMDSFQIANSGLKIYATDLSNGLIKQSTLATKDDLTSGTVGTSLDLSTWDTTKLGGSWTNGVKMFVASGATQTIRRYSM